MKTLKSKHLFTLIWAVLVLSALSSLFTLIKGISQFSAQPLLFWLTVLKLFTMGILLLMGLSLSKIVKTYGGEGRWQANYYQKVRQMGYWAIVLTLLNSVFQAGYEQIWRQLANPGAANSGLFIFRRFYGVLLMESPAMWVLTLSIFLFAELLRSAHEIKADNESII